MKSRLLRIVGAVLFALTILAFVALPFWIFAVFDRINDWVVLRDALPAMGHFSILVLFLPLFIMAILWTGFLLAWLMPDRAKSAYLPPESENRLAKTRARLILASGVLALAVTALVELGYLDWISGAALGSALDNSDSAVLHFYLFVEVPQLFLVLLWTPFLLVAWPRRPNSPATKPRLYFTISFLLLVVTGLVWIGYPDWQAGVGIVSVANKQIPLGAFRAFEAVPALYVACVWLFFVWLMGSSLRARGHQPLGSA
jgi:hypothetical protein